MAEAVVTTQRDWGNRTDRKNAKTKYTLERVGIETFKAEVERRAGIKFEPIRPYEFTGRGDRIGWVKGIDDKWHLTLFIENGRILDYPGRPLKTGLLEIAKIHQGEFRITANQNLIVASVPEDQKARIEKLARDHGLMNAVTRSAKLDGLRLLPDLPAGDGGSRAFPAVVYRQGGRGDEQARRER